MQNKKVSKDLTTIIKENMCAVLMLAVFLTAFFIKSHRLGGDYFSINRIRLAFGLSVISGITYLAWDGFKNKKLNYEASVRMVLASGVILRVCYMLYTGPGTRTHDVYREEWGHLDYIRYIAENLALPPVNTCQAYHPPVHHIMAAFVLRISEMFTDNEFISLKTVQALSALLNCLTLLIFYRTMKLTGLNGMALLTATSLFAFHPTNIYFASKINNDNTMMFFYTLAFYCMVKWTVKPSSGNVLLLAIATSLAMLTKKSAIMLFVPIAAVFLKELLENRSNPAKYIRQYSIFGLTAIPLSMWHNIRNYVLFRQSFSHVPSLGRGFEPTFFNLVYFPLDNVLKNPFNNGGLQGGEYFLEFLLKSSLFGEWPYPGLETIAYLLLFLAAANFLIMVVCIFRSKSRDFIAFEYIMLLNMAVPFLMLVKFRTDFPVACSQDFRYIAPVLISVSYYLGKATGNPGTGIKANKNNPEEMGQKQSTGSGILHKVAIGTSSGLLEKVPILTDPYRLQAAVIKVNKYAASFFIAAFCIVSVIFVLCLGNYQ